MLDYPIVILMKVGYHAQEEFHSIVVRKQVEVEVTGQAWWGYGGSACHPLNQVQPFARAHSGGVAVVFVPTDSRPGNPSMAAAEWSPDRIAWAPVPEGITVTGSKCALVLSELEEVEDSIDLARYCVGIGSSAGKPATAYLRGQSDKACLVRSSGSDETDVRRVVLRGHLADPWAVFLA